MTEQEWLESEDPVAMIGLDTENPGYVDVGALLVKISDRKLRLFSCAVWRMRSARFDPSHHKGQNSIVAFAERVADGEADLEDRPRLSLDTEDINNDYYPLISDAVDGARRMVRSILLPTSNEHIQQANLLREIIGNPFNKQCLFVTPEWSSSRQGYIHYKRDGSAVSIAEAGKYKLLDAGWLTPTVVTLAQAAYDDRSGQKCSCWGVDTDGKPIPAFACLKCHGTGRIEDGILDPDRLKILSDALEDAGCCGEKCELCEGAGQVNSYSRVKQVFCTVCGHTLQERDDIGNQRGGHLPKSCSRCMAGYLPEHIGCKKCDCCKGQGRLLHPIITHLRSSCTHVRGCWVIDLLLGKV